MEKTQRIQRSSPNTLIMGEVLHHAIAFLSAHAAHYPSLAEDFADDAMQDYFHDEDACRVAYVYRDYYMTSHGMSLMTLQEAVQKLSLARPHRAHVYHAATAALELYSACDLDELHILGW